MYTGIKIHCIYFSHSKENAFQVTGTDCCEFAFLLLTKNVFWFSNWCHFFEWFIVQLWKHAFGCLLLHIQQHWNKNRHKQHGYQPWNTSLDMNGFKLDKKHPCVRLCFGIYCCCFMGFSFPLTHSQMEQLVVIVKENNSKKLCFTVFYHSYLCRICKQAGMAKIKLKSKKKVQSDTAIKNQTTQSCLARNEKQTSNHNMVWIH